MNTHFANAATPQAAFSDADADAVAALTPLLFKRLLPLLGAAFGG